MPPSSPAAPFSEATAVRLSAATVPFDGRATPSGPRAVAVEVPVNVVYGTVAYAVMMTPADLEEFAVGFSLTEGIIAARAGRRTAGATAVGADAVRRALGKLPEPQVLNDATRAVHAAAWSGLDGTIHRVREDVGRHNALDKLIGALLNDGVDPSSGFLLITSRCSYEMVEKAAAFGAGALVAISAPTSLGVERARHHDITLVAIARPDAITVFSDPRRVDAEAVPA